MRQFLCKLALATALISGGAAMAQTAHGPIPADSADGAIFQRVASRGGGGGISRMGSASSTASVGAGLNLNTGSMPPGSIGTYSAPLLPGQQQLEVISPDTPMREPITPAAPPQPGFGSFDTGSQQ
jgi:hypothetical protein